VKNGFLRDYLQEKQGTEDVAVIVGGPRHEVPVHGEIHTIAGGFSGGGCTTTAGTEGVGEGAAVVEERARGLEVLAPPDTPRRRVRIPASLARFSSVRTIHACKEVGRHRGKTCECIGISSTRVLGFLNPNSGKPTPGGNPEEGTGKA